MIEAIRSADLIVIPPGSLNDAPQTVFPDGTSDLVEFLSRGLPEVSLAFVADGSNYGELVQHAREWKLPTLIVSSLLLPIVAQLLANYIERVLLTAETPVIAEAEIIVEGRRGRCISIRYKGPADRLPETLVAQTKDCQLHLEANDIEER
jgi:hypothetical protein